MECWDKENNDWGYQMCSTALGWWRCHECSSIHQTDEGMQNGSDNRPVHYSIFEDGKYCGESFYKSQSIEDNKIVWICAWMLGSPMHQRSVPINGAEIKWSNPKKNINRVIWVSWASQQKDSSGSTGFRDEEKLYGTSQKLIPYANSIVCEVNLFYDNLMLLLKSSGYVSTYERTYLVFTTMFEDITTCMFLDRRIKIMEIFGNPISG